MSIVRLVLERQAKQTASGNGTSTNSTSSSSSSAGSGYEGYPSYQAWLAAQPHDNLSPAVNYSVWFLTGASLVFLLLRLYCKMWRHRTLYWDDYLLTMSWLALLVNSVLLSYATSIGFGKHDWDINPVHSTALLLTVQAAGFCSLWAALWSKTSFAVTLLRLADGWTRCLVWLVIITVNIALGISLVTQWIQCSPVEKLWNQNVPGYCLSKQTIYSFNEFSAAYSGAMDIFLSFIPWHIVWKIAMNKKEKIGVVIAMSMGVFAGATSIAKCPLLWAILSIDWIHSPPLMILATAEGAVTIMAASVPILRPLFRSRKKGSSSSGFVYNENSWQRSLPSGEGTVKTVISSQQQSRSGGFKSTSQRPSAVGTLCSWGRSNQSTLSPGSQYSQMSDTSLHPYSPIGMGMSQSGPMQPAIQRTSITRTVEDANPGNRPGKPLQSWIETA